MGESESREAEQRLGKTLISVAELDKNPASKFIVHYSFHDSSYYFQINAMLFLYKSYERL